MMLRSLGVYQSPRNIEFTACNLMLSINFHILQMCIEEPSGAHL